MSTAAAVPLDNVRKMTRNRKPKSDTELSYQKQIGEQFTRVRQAKGLEVEQLAELLKQRFTGDVGFNRTSLYKHEQGERTLTPYRLQCAATVLDVPISMLFDEDAMRREVELIHSTSQIHAPQSLKKIKAGDALVVETVTLDDDTPIGEGYYVGGTSTEPQLFFIMPGDGSTQYAVESAEGLTVYSYSEFKALVTPMRSFYRVNYVVSKLNN